MINEQNSSIPVTRRSKDIDTHPKVITTEFSTVHVDKTMIGIDRGSGTITMTLLQQSLVPQIGGRNEWTLAEEHWKVVGEVKMPIGVMNSMLLYYVSEMTGGGVNVIQIMRQYLAEHPQQVNQNSISYGPTDIQQGG